MGTFVSVRGWIESSSEQEPELRRRISACRNDANTYAKAWVYSVAGGYSNFAFFGCTIRESIVTDLQDLLRELAQISSIDGEFTDYVSGVFHAKHENEELPETIWRLCNGKFTVLSANGT